MSGVRLLFSAISWAEMSRSAEASTLSMTEPGSESAMPLPSMSHSTETLARSPAAIFWLKSPGMVMRATPPFSSTAWRAALASGPS